MSNQSIETLELPSDITTIMNSWSLQTGYPIVTVRRNYDLQSVKSGKIRKKYEKTRKNMKNLKKYRKI
jgi:aminopeptidase N